MSQALIRGSLEQVAQSNGQSLAQTFISADVVVIVDCSGSMATEDSLGGRSRYGQACKELETLQGNLPGKVALVSFGSTTIFCPSGIPLQPRGGTDLQGALKFCKVADIPGAMRFIVISDGQPDDENGALQVAKTYKNKIDTIFVGPEGGYGLDFLKRLAAASGGSHVTAAAALGLASSVQNLLAAT